MFLPIVIPLDTPKIPNYTVSCECELPDKYIKIRRGYFIIDGKKYTKIIIPRKDNNGR